MGEWIQLNISKDVALWSVTVALGIIMWLLSWYLPKKKGWFQSIKNIRLFSKEPQLIEKPKTKPPSQHPTNITSDESDKKEAPVASARLQFDVEKHNFFVIETKGIKSLTLLPNRGIFSPIPLPTINMVFSHGNGPYEIEIHTSEGSGNFGGSDILRNCIGYLIQENKDAFVSICPKPSQLVLLTSHEVTFNFYRKA